MATAATPSKRAFIELFECPVCMDKYRDPRILKCGHHFCKQCLEGVVYEHPQGSARCPTCYRVTEFTVGSGVTDLPRPVLINELQEKVGSVLDLGEGQGVDRHCDICGHTKVKAVSHCYQCRKNLCEGCRNKHSHLETTAAHRVVPISDSMFCAVHPKEILHLFCTDCSSAVCSGCLFGTHSDHHVVELSSKANDYRRRLQEFIRAAQSLELDKRTNKQIQKKIVESSGSQSNLFDSVSRMRGLLKELENKLDGVEKETSVKLAAVIEPLVQFESSVKGLQRSKQSLVDRARYLTEKASDLELLEQGENFPTFPDVSEAIKASRRELPVFAPTFERMCSGLQQMITDCKVEDGHEKMLSTKRMNDLRKKHTINVGAYLLSGLTVDVKRRQLIIRTLDTRGPLKVYDYQGQLLESIGADIPQLPDDGYLRGVCVDSKRDILVAPSENSLLLVNRAGRLLTSVWAGGGYNSAVSYGEHSDIYVVAEFNLHRLYLLAAASHEVTREVSLGSPGFRLYQIPKQNSSCYDVHIGNVIGFDIPLIVVSSNFSQDVRLFDTSLGLIKTYVHGDSSRAGVKLTGPWGVCTYNKGCVIICETHNKRLLRVWTGSSGRNRFKKVLENDWGGQRPWHLALDPNNMVMAIGRNDHSTVDIYY